MGNQLSAVENRQVFEKSGRFIVPNKLNLKTVQEENIVNNIFGVNDPTLLSRTYWAKENNKSPLKQNNQKSPIKSRLQKTPTIRENHHHDQPNEFVSQLNKQNIAKSAVTDFKLDRGLQKTPSRNLSKMTSYTIINKLSKVDDEFEEATTRSPLKASQITRDKELNYSKYSKDKESFNYLLGKSKRTLSKSKIDHQVKEDRSRSSSAIKDRTNFSQVTPKKKADEQTIKLQISNVFGLQTNKNLECQLQSEKHAQPSKIQSKMQEDSSNHCRFNQKLSRQETQSAKKQVFTPLASQQVCEQTFSRFQQIPTVYHNATELSKSSLSHLIEKSERASQRTSSKKSNIQQYEGLNEDSHNESLMKVLKRITDLNLVIEDDENNDGSSKAIKISQSSNKQFSRISVQNKRGSQKRSFSRQLNSSKKSKNFEKSLQLQIQESEIKHSQKSQKSQNIHKSLKINKQTSQKSDFERNSKRFQDQNIFRKSKSKSYTDKVKLKEKSIPNFSEHYQNESQQIYQTQNSQAFDEKDSETFRFPRNKSPRSIASEQVAMNEKMTVSENKRLIETSKANKANNHQSPFKIKNFDLSRKQVQKLEKKLEQSYAEQRSQSSKSQKPTTKDYELLAKIQQLEQQIKRLKKNQQRQKYESRRYSPVKEENVKRSAITNEYDDNSYHDEDTYCSKSKCSKYSINELSSGKTFKKRAQYFKLNLK